MKLLLNSKLTISKAMREQKSFQNRAANNVIGYRKQFSAVSTAVNSPGGWHCGHAQF